LTVCAVKCEKTLGNCDCPTAKEIYAYISKAVGKEKYSRKEIIEMVNQRYGHLMRKAPVFIIVFGILALIAPLGLLYATDDPMSKAGVLSFLERKSAPDFALEDVEGRWVKLTDFRDKIVLLAFWTTW
jgi:hypothetical protein